MPASVEIHLEATLTAGFAVIVTVIVVQYVHLKIVPSEIVRVIVDILTVELWITRFCIKVPVDTHHRCDDHEFRVVEWIGILHYLIIVVITVVMIMIIVVVIVVV